jgi:4-amino-4-deoxy-L-arabinose transferase-like glycosyltransferase
MKANDQPNSVKQPFFSGADHLTLLFILAVTTLRTAALAISPLELGVDEAQYWLWSKALDFGYFTKPPMIAWIIGASHWLFGHHVMAVRLPACWLNFATALVLWQTATWLYGPKAGRWASLLWISLPAVGLGSFLISTDTPLLLCISLALLAVAGSSCNKIPPTHAMIYAGFALGVGMLAKYAALYGLFGLLLIWAIGRHQPAPIIRSKHLLLALVAFLMAASPNLVWNIAHDFSTMRHLGDNANLAKQTNNLTESLIFLISQAVVAGPLVFVLMSGILRAARHERHAGWLIWMAVPVLILMSLQAYLSEANANWAMTAYPALCVWLGGWIAGYTTKDNNADKKLSNARIWAGYGAFGVNACLTITLLIITMAGSLGPVTPESDPLRRLRGWHQLASDLEQQLVTHETARIIADRRATASLLSWHFRNKQVTIMVHDADGMPSNHFEANHSWKRVAGSPVLVLSGSIDAPPFPDINWQAPPTRSLTVISNNQVRDLYIHFGVE